MHGATHPQLWIEGIHGYPLQHEEIFKGYNSAIGPAAFFYKEIMTVYPEVKVILTIRDMDSWWSSFSGTVLTVVLQFSSGRYLLKRLYRPFRRWHTMVKMLLEGLLEEEEAKSRHLRHIEEVKATVPADKLLVYSVKEGWEPLCTFLEVPVPDVPFPYLNKRSQMQRYLWVMSVVGWVLALLITAGVIGGIALAYGKLGKAAAWCMIMVVLCVFCLPGQGDSTKMKKA
ncbi:unnamed protein product [Discosporangium mesarthrocarpum]